MIAECFTFGFDSDVTAVFGTQQQTEWDAIIAECFIFDLGLAVARSVKVVVES
jgi:hypothetical protein